jgi:hypothetical protein
MCSWVVLVAKGEATPEDEGLRDLLRPPPPADPTHREVGYHAQASEASLMLSVLLSDCSD